MVIDDAPLQAGLHGLHLPARRVVDLDADQRLRDRLNSKPCVLCHRILLWAGRRPSIADAALLRHELRHAEQQEADGRIPDLAELARDVLSIGEHSGCLYNGMPTERDANSAAHNFVMAAYGEPQTIAAAAEFDGPPVLKPARRYELSSLRSEMILFLAEHLDLCRAFASELLAGSDPDVSFSRRLSTTVGDKSAGEQWMAAGPNRS
jgi:hypothetical protein